MARVSLLLLCSLGAVLSSTVNAAALDFYVYGDSVSDSGNTYRSSGRKVPQAGVYWQGRFTNNNGNWADHIKQGGGSLVTVTNFAFGGASACPTTKRGAPPSLTQQVTRFQRPDILSSAFLTPRLHVLWAGHDDLLNGPSPAQITQNAQRVVRCLEQAALVLLNQGESVVITTLLPTNNAQKNAALDSVNAMIRQMHQALKQRYGVQAFIWDPSKLMKNIVSKAKQNGFKDAKSACVVYGPGGNPLAGSKPKSVCKKPNDLVFFDSYHPNTKVHTQLANDLVSGPDMKKQLQDAVNAVAGGGGGLPGGGLPNLGGSSDPLGQLNQDINTSFGQTANNVDLLGK